MNEVVKIGHNLPPSAIDMARDAFRDLSAFLAENPVIADHATARAAKLQLDRIKATAKDLEEADKAESGPLYEAWKASKAKFAPALDATKKITGELATRIKAFLDAEEDKRRAEAAEAARKAAEAIRLMEEAARLEIEAQENAAVGEFVDVGAAILAGAQAEDAANRAARAAVIAERDADNVRLIGGFGRAISVRTVKKPIVEDWRAAIKVMGLTDDIDAAIIKSARAYKKLKGGWPKGISEIEERVL